MYNLASSLVTREIVYIATNVNKGRPQLNSHRDDDFGRCYKREQIDGFNAVEIASCHTPYNGNDWQAKYSDFIAKWSGSVA
jgi:hypothetical protein